MSDTKDDRPGEVERLRNNQDAFADFRKAMGDNPQMWNAPTSSPAFGLACSSEQVSAVPTMGCGVCGGALVTIRGRDPGGPRRDVCPTCLAERMDEIRRIVEPTYALAFRADPSRAKEL